MLSEQAETGYSKQNSTKICETVAIGTDMDNKPQLKNDEYLYRLLREGHIDAFNEARERGESSDLTNCDFRGVDLRGMNADGLDLSGCYFRQADLRGIDFSSARLEGSSIHATKISGVYFPVELSADEITLSLIHGTRLRYSTS